MKFGN